MKCRLPEALNTYKSRDPDKATLKHVLTPSGSVEKECREMEFEETVLCKQYFLETEVPFASKLEITVALRSFV